MSKYHKQIRSESIDVYDVLVAFGVTNPAVQHAIKKLLAPGQRGYKDTIQDLTEARQSIDRAIEIEKGSIVAVKADETTGSKVNPWVEWKGGECPVQAGFFVDYKMRDGEAGSRDSAIGLDWHHAGKDWDIVAYRVVK